MKKTIAILLIISIMMLVLLPQVTQVYATTAEPQVSYRTHVQNLGWQPYVKNGADSGTSHQALRLEGINIKLENIIETGGGISYRTHVQNIGWQAWKQNGEMAGTEHQALRLEAIQIKLTGQIANSYDIYYRVHVQNVGWLDWAKNGQAAGSSGYSYRLEAIQIKLVKKGATKPGATAKPFVQTYLAYQTHVQNIGWTDLKRDGAISGSMGKAYRLEAIKIGLTNPPYSGNIEYSTHVQNIGWQNFSKNNQIAGTSGKSLRLEGIRIRLTGEMEKHFHVLYRTYVQNLGWQTWKKNGEEAGTSGKGLRLEAIEIKLVPKEEEKIIHGIDVANMQGKIDWEAVKKDGIEFAMIRVGFRGYGVSSDGVDGKLVIDDSFEYNITNAIKANIPVGVYFFSQAKTEQEAIEEANLTINSIKNYKITYPVAIDTEYANSTHTGRADSLSKEERTKVVKAFCERIKQAGYEPMLYTGKYFALNNLDMGALSKYDLWLAHYTGVTQQDPLKKPSNYTGKYAMWQYTETGTANGIEGYVDRNICYKVY